MKDIKKALKSGENLLGTIIVSASPVSIEISGYLGYDFVLIDSEHASSSPLGIEMENLIRAAYAADITPIVRVIRNDVSQIRKVLDFGAKGVVAPFINDKEATKKLVDACLFPPEGDRGGAPVIRATKYGAMSWSEYVKKSNEETIIMPIIERMQAIGNLEEILSVKGINSVLCGPFDLAMELGIKPKGDSAVSETLQMLTDPAVLEHMDTIIRTAKKNGIYVGNIAWSIDSAVDMVKRGCQLIAFTGDNNMLMEIARRYLDETREGINHLTL